MSPTLIGVLLVVLAAAIEGFGQIFLKKSTLEQVRRPVWLASGMAVFAVQAVVYTGALKFLDVSTAFALGTLSFVSVALLSKWLLREPVTISRWVGVGLIMAGASLIVVSA
jgi:undecaprenyl phosphate-alpha-L-ara4N flippase subunit ArnE